MRRGQALKNHTSPSGLGRVVLAQLPKATHSPELCFLPPPQTLFNMHIRYCALYKTAICTEAQGGGGKLGPPPDTSTCRDLQSNTNPQSLYSLAQRFAKRECLRFPSSPCGLAGSFSSALPEMAKPLSFLHPQPFLTTTPALSSELRAPLSLALNPVSLSVAHLPPSFPSSLRVE